MTLIAQRATGGLVKFTVLTGGTGYTSPPTVQVSGGSGATAYAQLSAGRVASVIVASPGSGYQKYPSVSFSGGGGTGAAATAYAYTGPAVPASFFRGRYGDLYAVDGMGRGIRWDGASTSSEPIGINPPLVGPQLTAGTSAASGILNAVQIVDAGENYTATPSVTITGGTPSRPAKATASISNGRLSSLRITDTGAGYQSTPTVSLSGGRPDPPSLSAGVLGKVRQVRIVASGSGYTTDQTFSPSVVFSSAQGLTQAIATCSVNAKGEVESIALVHAGTGATTTGATASVVGGGGAGCLIELDMSYRVTGVTVVSGGSGHFAAPQIEFRPAVSDQFGGGAAATATANSAGSVTAVTVFAGGEYADIPTPAAVDRPARLVGTLSPPLRGKYKCCTRYLDDTGKYIGGPIPSSISDLVELDCGDGASSIEWTLTHPYAEPRVAAVELWRTSSDQSVLLFLVATIQRSEAAFSGSYTDTLTDDELTDAERDGYALMPVTLPSGQINARRFAVPPGEFAVAVMFQDRAWYAVDTSGERPNSLCYSEIDEPESVPEANELVVQENTGTPDRIVALVPLGPELLVVQRRHTYKLSYVAQPVIDASVALGAYRGALNSRCWAVMGGVAFLADSFGVYAYDGRSEDPLSVPIDDIWRNGEIDFSKSDLFHVAADFSTKIVRFFYCTAEDAAPTRALCYCVSTKAWWRETYPEAITSSCVSTVSGVQRTLYGSGDGVFRELSGRNDGGQAIPFLMRTGNFPLSGQGPSRSVSLLYTPTNSDQDLSLRLHYNDSPNPRPNAISTNTGHGFVAAAGATAATLNMKSTRSALGESNGYVRAYYSGRNDDRSSGGDRHVAIAIAGSQAGSTAGDEVVIHGIGIEGAG